MHAGITFLAAHDKLRMHVLDSTVVLPYIFILHAIVINVTHTDKDHITVNDPLVNLIH